MDESISAPSGPRLFVTLLGHMRVEVDGVPFVMTTRRRTLPLLAYLLLHRREQLARDFVAFLLWPDDPEEDALTKLRSNIHELTKALPPGGAAPWLAVSGTNIGWNPATALELDVERFEAAANDPERLDEALKLYTGDLLEGIDDEWILAERERLQMLLFAALERGIARASRAGDLARAVACGQHLLARDPFREDVLRRVMGLRDASGDRSGALAEYRKFEAYVRRELGVDPMPETLALRDQIARGEAPFLTIDAAEERVPQTERGCVDAAPLIGRDGELAKLTSLWHRTRARRGGVVFVGGEAGIGKSRLTAHFSNDVADAGGRVMAGGTSAPEAGPYQALVEALRSALPLVAALRLEPLWKQTLATLVPELANEASPAPPTLPSAAQSARVHEAAARALVALATPRPLVVVLEDVHWASAPTIDALRALARRIALEPILIVVTYRDDELDGSHPLAAAIRELCGDALGETVPLRPLQLPDVEELARRAHVPLERAVGIHRATAGNPFFITQLLANDARDDAVPDAVHDAVAARFERLPESARHIAEIAALAGSNFSREVLCEVAGWNAAEVGDALDVLIGRRLVRERTGRGAFNLGFAHEIVRQTILAAAPVFPDRHRRVARVIETCYPERAGELALELATHYERAGAPVEAARRYARAARRALDLGAVGAAEAALERGLDLEIDPRTRAELTALAIEAGGRGDVATQLASIERLEALARELDDEDSHVAALTARAELYAKVGRNHSIDGAAELMRERARERGEARWSAVADLTDAIVCVEAGDDERAAAFADRALPVFRSLDDDLATVRCLFILNRIAVRRADRAGARRVCDEIEQTAERSERYLTKIAALAANHARVVQFGTPEESVALTSRWIALTLEAGDRREETRARDNHSHALLIAGRGGAAMESSEAAFALAREIGLDGGNRTVLINHATVALKLGGFARAIEILERVIEARRADDETDSFRAIHLRATMGLACAYHGDLGTAAEIGELALEACDRMEQSMGHRAVALENLAETRRLRDDHLGAFESASEALRLREAHGLGARAKSAALAALAAARLGRFAAARELLARADDGAPAVFAGTYWRERTALHIAQARRCCGDVGEAERWLAVAENEIAATLDGLREPWRAHYLATWWAREVAEARGGRWPEPLA